MRPWELPNCWRPSPKTIVRRASYPQCEAKCSKFTAHLVSIQLCYHLFTIIVWSRPWLSRWSLCVSGLRNGHSCFHSIMSITNRFHEIQEIILIFRSRAKSLTGLWLLRGIGIRFRWLQSGADDCHRFNVCVQVMRLFAKFYDAPTHVYTVLVCCTGFGCIAHEM
jgi:hypothetical protein